MNRVVWGLLVAAAIAPTARAQQPGVPGRASFCGAAISAAARLICADPDLAARDAKLVAAYRQVKSRSSASVQMDLLKEQQTWMRERDQKCGLTGKDRVPIDELRKAKRCMQEEMDARLAELQTGAQSNTAITNAVPTGSAIAARRQTDPATADATSNGSIIAPEAPINPASPDAAATGWTSAPNVPVPAKTVSTSTANVPTSAPNVPLTSTSPSNPPASVQGIVIKPAALTPAVPADTGEGSHSPTSPTFSFSASVNGVSGTADCKATSSSQEGQPLANTPLGGRSIVKITITDDANSYRMFESDAWTAFLNDLRSTIHFACASTLQGAGLRGVADQSSDPYAVFSSQGLFAAYSTTINTPWIVRTNLPQARKKLESDLGIQKWIEPSELARNPYFFKDQVVGMVIRFDREISEDEAVFAQADARIFVAGLPHNKFANRQMVVLVGRVTGNRGVIDPSGNEELMPALDYLGASNCEKSCVGLEAAAP